MSIEETADDMFRRLRHKTAENDEIIWLQRKLNKLAIKDIIFDLKERNISVKILYYDQNSNLLKKDTKITVQELQAINKKVEELRLEWMI